MNFPSDFTKSWPSSDVILIAEDAQGNKRELHATRTYLSVFSTFFEGMFSSDFKEANSNSVELSCSYEVLKIILEVIYGHGRDYSKVKQTYDVDVLTELYNAADYLDIPFIRGLCTDQMLDRPSVEMATGVLVLVISGLGLHDTLMEILKKMDPDDLQDFLGGNSSHLLFSKEDIVTIFHAIAKKALPKPPLQTWWACRSLPDIYENCDNSSIDFTKKFPWSDVLIKTKNSDEKELYSCKAVLAIVSPHFSEIFTRQPDSSAFAEIELDVDYIIMKNILSIIHQCYNHDILYNNSRDYIFMLYVMFRFASEDKLNIPKVRELCTHSLKEIVKKSKLFSVHLDICLMITGAKAEVLRKIEATRLLLWVQSNGVETDDFYHFEGNTYRVQYTDNKKPVLSLNDVRIIVEKLLSEYTK